MISKLIEKLSKPHWMPSDPRILVSNLTPEYIGQLNLMWVMLGRINITANFFAVFRSFLQVKSSPAKNRRADAVTDPRCCHKGAEDRPHRA